MRVVATGAAAAASGTVVFVVVINERAARSPVIVRVRGASANGGPPVTGSATIPSMGADETEAAMVRLSVPPNDVLGVVTASAAGVTAVGKGNPLSASAASFTPDPINPAVDVTVSTAASVTASVLAVCYRAGIVVGGGMAESARVRAGAPTTLHLAAALTDTPNTCLGYAYPAA